ncbi:MAG: hypothetical protein ACRC20_10930 [Segniliparus sp.]|uniref:hypothetical protein n=1 Tax=Segniliparus sp. TaxID=2804064 RepID=UPI003F3BE329
MSAPSSSSGPTASRSAVRDWPSVRDWPLEGLGDVETALDRRVASLREYEGDIARASGLEESSWSGPAAEAARALASAHTGHSAALASSAQVALEALREYRSSAEALRAAALKLEAEASSHGLAIGQDGSVSGNLPGLYGKAVARKLAERASEVLAGTAALDRSLAEALVDEQ